MTHHDNLKTVTDACIAANPEIAELKVGCEFDWTGEDYIERRMVVARALGTESIDGSTHGFELYVYEKDNATSQISSISSEDFEEGESFEDSASNIGRPITAADVLLALGRNYAFDGEGLLIEWGRGEWSYDLDPIKFDLRLPISGQTPKAVAALATLLKRDD